MKTKFAIILLTMCSVAVHAASITWNASSSITKFDGSSVGKNATGYIVYLGTTDISTLTYSDILAMATVKDQATNVGKWNNVGVTVDSTKTGNYAMYMAFTSGEKTYYNISSSVYNLTTANIEAFLNEGTALPTQTYSFTDAKPTSTPSTAKAGAGWVAVPEPSTAALALAGLALLLKRRKA